MTPLSISRAISGKAEADPDRPCITFEGRTVTRRAFDRATNRLARAYARRGVTKGDLVTIALPNSIAFYEAAVAAWKLGATPQPVSWRLPLRERQAIVQLGNPRLIVGAAPADHPDHAVLPPGFVPDAALDDGMLPDVIAPCWKAPTSGGSTGRPKLILAGRPGVVSGKAGLLVDFGDDGCHVVPGPLYHNAPFASSMQGLFRGNHIVVLPKFDAERTLQAVARHRATFLLLVPTMMLRIWRLPPDVRQRHDLSSLRAVQHLAAPCPAWLKEAWIDWLGAERIFELYAGVEAQAVCEIRGDDWLAHRGSVGRVLMGELRVVDADGTDVAPGQVGEIYMRNSAAGNASYTYVGAEARRLAGNWESIGDIGWMDEDGYVYLTDRRSDMVLVGGSNVYPAEVENAIQEHDAVLSCAVIGLPDEDMGNRLHAIVQTARPIAAADFDGFLSDRLVRYKQPRSYEFVDWPVRDDAGKVRRAALTQERAATMAVQA
jgi:bile acid-coenzyme A ligase